MCWDHLAARTGVSLRSSGKLARAVLRSFLIHPWNLPLEVDLGPIEDSNEWPRERAEAPAVFGVLLGRVGDADVAEIITGQLPRLGTEHLQQIRETLEAELARRGS